jgi:HEAT repeat protein
MIVFAIALASFFILVAADRMPANDTIARRFIQSELQNERISAFKYIIRNKEIAHLIDLYDVKQLDKAGVAERYWFANASSLRAKETFDVLVRQLGDPQANVVCQAIYALGKSNERKALNYIMDVVRKSDHWYIQWYAYRALVNLGWRQAYKEIKENNGDDEKQ